MTRGWRVRCALLFVCSCSAQPTSRPSAAPPTRVATPAPVTTAPQSAPEEILLWPSGAPGSEGLALVEHVDERPLVNGRRNRAVSGITRPSLTRFTPAKPDGSALIVIPGGGYVREAIDKEGTAVAAWFSERGVSAFVLKYRLPSEGHANARDVPLLDAERAMRLVREHAAAWQLDPKRIGVLGFSAGGHLAAQLGNTRNVTARPNAAILLYPVISLEDPIAHPGSRDALLGRNAGADLQRRYSSDHGVHASNPPTLLIWANDDASVSPENSVRLCRALERAGVSVAAYPLAVGGHGFGLGAPGSVASAWTEYAWHWFQRLGSGHFSAPLQACPGGRTTPEVEQVPL